MHEEIKQYWINKGYSIKHNGSSWVLYIDEKHITTIAYFHIHEMWYWKEIYLTGDSVSETEMLSYVRLQAFL